MITIEEIKEFLPQRYPFLMVDRILEVEPFESIVGLKNVTVNEPFFNGHFPFEAVMPGVLIIEAMAQTAGILGFVSGSKTIKDGYNYLLVGADKARFKRQVVPGDQLKIHAKFMTMRRNILKFDCQAYVDDELAASVILTVAGQPFDASKLNKA